MNQYFPKIRRRELFQGALGAGLAATQSVAGAELQPGARSSLDRWGITKLLPTTGLEWLSKWDNGIDRKIVSGGFDPSDSMCQARGTGPVVNGREDVPVVIYGKRGYAVLQGAAPRLYIYQRDNPRTFGNAEITLYMMRVAETGYVSSQGCAIGTRSTHQQVVENDQSTAPLGTTQHVRVTYGGTDPADGRFWPTRVIYQKEGDHHFDAGYSANKPSERNFTDWPTRTGRSDTMPKNTWYGFKWLIQNASDGSLRMRTYRDLTGGAGGGDWRLIAEYLDDGGWTYQHNGSRTDAIMSQSGSVYIRNDNVVEARYKWFSIRTVSPEA